MPSADLHAITTLQTSVGPTAGQPCPVTFTRHGNFYEVRAAPGAAGERHGLGMFVDERLIISWGPKDKVEIGAYRIAGKEMTGTWVPPGARGSDMSICGHERSTQVEPNTYEIVEAKAIDGSAYTGRITIEPLEPGSDLTPPFAARMRWHLNDGEYASFAIAFGQAMFAIFSFQPDDWHAISVFEPQQDGSYRGNILEKDMTQLQPESLSL